MRQLWRRVMGEMTTMTRKGRSMATTMTHGGRGSDEAVVAIEADSVTCVTARASAW